MKHFFTLAVASAFLIVSCSPKAEGPDYQKEIEKIITEAQIPVIDLEYNSPSEKITVFAINKNFYDSSRIANNTAVARPAVFQAASLSKVVFSYIVLKAVDNGEIDLDTPLCEYTDIDRFKDKESARKLTARMVLQHRTGLPNWSDGPSSQTWPTSVIEFKFPPDSCYGYSGEGFAFLQRAIESIKGKGIEEIAEEEVFGPLGMTNSSYVWRDEYDSLAVDGYNGDNENRGKGDMPRANVAYTLRTNAADYTKFLQAIMKGEGLKPETAALFFTPDTHKAIRYADNHRACDSTIYWGMGIGVEKNPSHGDILWHWGDNGNYKALFIILPKDTTTLVYFTNSNHGHDIINEVTTLMLKDTASFAINDWINE